MFVDVCGKSEGREEEEEEKVIELKRFWEEVWRRAARVLNQSARALWGNQKETADRWIRSQTCSVNYPSLLSNLT